MIRLLLLLFFCLSQLALYGQFPPAADQPGTTAIHKDSSIFINWAQSATVERGQQNISDDSLNFAEFGEPELALGIADNQTVSLGDGGTATLFFNPPITNGAGPDFAVFENGFSTQGGYFLELAFVEVSSDGVNFVRFPATSLTDTTTQLSTFDLVDPTKIDNLAGKYVSGFGTPFDLVELADSASVNIEAISFVRVVDVVGSLADSLATFDANGRKVNDPFPTPFPSGGFDLDAVGVIHQKLGTSTVDWSINNAVRTYPNPVKVGQSFTITLPPSTRSDYQLQLFSPQGILLKNQKVGSSANWSIDNKGVYFLKISQNAQSIVQKIVVSR